MFTVTKRLEVSASHQLKLDCPASVKIYMGIIDYYRSCSF